MQVIYFDSLVVNHKTLPFIRPSFCFGSLPILEEQKGQLFVIIHSPAGIMRLRLIKNFAKVSKRNVIFTYFCEVFAKFLVLRSKREVTYISITLSIICNFTFTSQNEFIALALNFFGRDEPIYKTYTKN